MVEVIRGLLKVRAWQRTHLNLGQSYLPYDILLTVLEGEKRSGGISVKELLASLPHSSTGLRYHLRRLIDEGWVESVAGTPDDARVRLLRPTERLRSEFRRYVFDALRELADVVATETMPSDSGR